jgi:calcium permeable stress-gated cation channel
VSSEVNGFNDSGDLEPIIASNRATTISSKHLPSGLDGTKDSSDSKPEIARNHSSAMPSKIATSNPDGSKDPGNLTTTPSYHVEPPTPTTARHDDKTRPSTSSSRNKIGHTDWTKGFLEPAPKRGWKIWRDSHGVAMPSPEPKSKEDAELKIAGAGGTSRAVETEDNNSTAEEKYPSAFDEQYIDDSGFEQEPKWKQYLTPGDRKTMRLPLFKFTWLPFMPSWTFLGEKVDTIYYCRKEIARLNLEIEQDQSEPEKFPLMNSAFIQFNSQVAAHMACQSVSHHMPSHMAPRLVEIAPGDVIWDNMSMKWWERYLRMILVVAVVVGLILAWAIPVSFLTSLANLSDIRDRWPHIFGFIGNSPFTLQKR